MNFYRLQETLVLDALKALPAYERQVYCCQVVRRVLTDLQHTVPQCWWKNLDVSEWYAGGHATSFELGCANLNSLREQEKDGLMTLFIPKGYYELVKEACRVEADSAKVLARAVMLSRSCYQERALQLQDLLETLSV